jgi:hypothetical protein
MTPTLLERRVGVLEQAMERCEELTARVAGCEQQILHLRGETQGEFSAMREEMAAGFREVRSEMATEFKAVRSEMAAEFGAVRQEMRDGDEETRREMRVLHEDLVERIKLLGEGLNGAGRRKPAGGQRSSRRRADKRRH